MRNFSFQISSGVGRRRTRCPQGDFGQIHGRERNAYCRKRGHGSEIRETTRNKDEVSI